MDRGTRLRHPRRRSPRALAVHLRRRLVHQLAQPHQGRTFRPRQPLVCAVVAPRRSRHPPRGAVEGVGDRAPERRPRRAVVVVDRPPRRSLANAHRRERAALPVHPRKTHHHRHTRRREHPTTAGMVRPTRRPHHRRINREYQLMPPPVHIALVGCFVLLVVGAITGVIVVTKATLRQRRRPPRHHHRPDHDGAHHDD